MKSLEPILIQAVIDGGIQGTRLVVLTNDRSGPHYNLLIEDSKGIAIDVSEWLIETGDDANTVLFLQSSILHDDTDE